MSTVTFVCYHYLARDDAFSRIWGHDIELFKAHLTHLTSKYTPVSVSDIHAYLSGSGILPERCVVFSFDDSLAEQGRIIAPLLEAEGIRAMFNVSPIIFNGEPLAPQVVHFGTAYYGIRAFAQFVREVYERTNNSPVDFSYIENEKDLYVVHKQIKQFLKYQLSNKAEAALLRSVWHEHLVTDIPDIHAQVYMQDSEIAELSARGHDIGLHTNSHTLVNDETFSSELLQDEIIDAKARLEDVTKKSVSWFSYPYALKTDVLYEESSVTAVREAGFEFLFTIFDKDNTDVFDPNFIGRYSSQSGDTIDILESNLWHYALSNSHQ